MILQSQRKLQEARGKEEKSLNLIQPTLLFNFQITGKQLLLNRLQKNLSLTLHPHETINLPSSANCTYH